MIKSIEIKLLSNFGGLKLLGDYREKWKLGIYQKF